MPRTVFTVRKTIWTVAMFLVGIVFLLPFFWMLTTSLKPESEVFNFPIEWVPQSWNAVENYQKVWAGKTPFLLYYWNSFLVTMTTTLLSVLVSAMAAYGFSKVRFKGRNMLFLIVVALFTIPPQVNIISQFILFRQLNLFDTHLGIVLLNGFSIFGTFLLRQFFMSLSDEYIEAAKIDGAGHIRIFTHIVLPLVRPAIATFFILKFIWTWNDYQVPFIFLRSRELFTVQLAIAEFRDTNGQFYSLIMAGTVSAILPLVIVFFLTQKHVIKGVAMGGIKG